MTTRRSFLSSILAAGMAPAAVGSGILMPVKKIIAPIPDLFVYDYESKSVLGRIKSTSPFVVFIHPEWADELQEAAIWEPGQKLYDGEVHMLRTLPVFGERR